MESARPGAGFTRLWTGSYTRRILFSVTALVSAVVILSAAASYLVMHSQISKMAAERTLLELHRTAASFSIMFATSIIPAAEQVFETTEVNNLIYGREISPQELLTATQLLDRFQLANPLIDSIAVYNSQRGTIYSTRYGLSPAAASPNAALMRIFRSIRDFKLYRFIPRIEDGKHLLTVILGTRPYSGNALLGGLVVNVGEAEVRRQLLGRFGDDGTRLTILDSSGTILSDTDVNAFGKDAMTYPLLARVAKLGGGSGTFTIGRGGSTALVTYFREPLAGWTFVSATPARILFAGIARWRNEIILIFAILLALSLALSVTASGRVSVPLERLLAQARALQAGLSELRSREMHGDEIAVVSETMELLYQRLHELSHGQEQALPRVFARLLLEQNVSDEERALARRSLFDTASGEVRVLAFAVDGMEGSEKGEWRVGMLTSCRELTRQLGAAAELICAVQMERGTVAAALPAQEAEAGFALPEAAREALASVTASAHLSFTVGVSDPVSHLDELSVAYDMALEAVRYRFREGPGKVIVREARGADEAPYTLPEEELRRLGEQGRLLNEPTVSEGIRSLLDGVMSHSYEDFVFLVQNLLHVLERVFVDSRTMDSRELADYRGRILDVRSIETRVDAEDLALSWYRRFLESARERAGLRLPSFVADVKTVIERELSDPDLSAKSIAAQLRNSVNYVRSTWRSATGESISGYMTRLRIERCKSLLESTSMPVKEIAHAVGFRNYTYFFTLFKKQTGQTPQEYQREIAMKR